MTKIQACKGECDDDFCLAMSYYIAFLSSCGMVPRITGEGGLSRMQYIIKFLTGDSSESDLMGVLGKGAKPGVD